MKDRTATILAAAVKQQVNPSGYVNLIEVTLPTDPPIVYRFANFDRDILFDQTSSGSPLRWQAFDIAIGDFTETKRGDLAQLQIAISNVRRQLSGVVDGYIGLGGQRVRILTVNVASLNDPAAKLLFVGKVVACEADEEVITFTLGQPTLQRAAFPARRTLTTCNVVRFGDADCGYPIPASPTESIGGGFSKCGRTLPECKKRGLDEVARGLVQLHPRRFDGRPGLAPGNE